MASGTFNIQTNNENISGYVSWEQKNVDSVNNTSDLLMIAYLRRTNNYSGEASSTTGISFNRIFFCDGKSNIIEGSTSKVTIPNDKSYVEIARATFTGVAHNSDGTLSLTIGFQATHGNNNSSFTVPKTTSTITLDAISRYASITSFSVSSVTKDSVTLTYSTDVAIDSVQYSLNNGAFQNLSSTNTITGLTSDTTYSIKIQVRRTDSQQWTTSDAITITTLKSKSIKLKKDGSWKEAIPYIKVNGVWKEAKPYIKINGSWKEGV